MHKRITTGLITLFCLANSAWAYQTKNGQIIIDEKNNEIVQINGVNWSGFQDNAFVDELTGNVPFYPIHQQNQAPKIGIVDMLTNPEKYPDQTFPKSTLPKNPPGITVKSVSFKTVRIPIIPNTLRDTSPNTGFQMYLTDPKDRTAGNGYFCDWSSHSGDQPCSKPLSVKESFYSLIAGLKEKGIRVLVDFHQIVPKNRDGRLVGYGYVLEKTNDQDKGNYKDDITELAREIKKRNLDNVIGIDVFNEPYNLLWFEQNGDQPPWADVIATAAQAVFNNNPDLMLFVEGASVIEFDTPICLILPKDLPPIPNPKDKDAYGTSRDVNACGDDEKVDKVDFKSNFGEKFRALLDREAAKNGQAKMGTALYDYLKKKVDAKTLVWLLGDPTKKNDGAHIVFSPHIYGAHVANWQSTKIVSPYRFHWNFGFLQDANYPVVIGESGYIPDQRQDPFQKEGCFSDENTDEAFFVQSVAPYLIKKRIHNNLFAWTFNSDSGDTGGIRINGSDAALVFEKERDLHNLFNGIDVQCGKPQLSRSVK